MDSTIKRGKLVTLEGGEGSGKSTQVVHLARFLREQGIETVITREPGGVPFSERLRELILQEPPSSAKTEFLMFAAARTEHIAGLIQPALMDGRWVVCDRYIDSTRVYQGVLGGIDAALIKATETYTVAPFLPDLTFLLDVNPKLGLERAKARGELSRYDAADEDDHAKVRKGFLDIAASEPGRCVVIDGQEREMEIAGQIAQIVKRRFL